MDNFHDLLNDRFEFHQSGSFFVRTKYFGVIRIFVIITAIILTFAFPNALMWVTGVDMNSERINDYTGYYMLTIGFVTLLIWIIAFAVIGIVKHGQKCSYTADENGLRLNCGWRQAEYKYGDVKFVTYVPIKDTGKMVGYNVTILKKDGTSDNYIYISPYKGDTITQENTPFYLLQHPPVPLRQAQEEKKDIGIVF